MSVCDEMLWVSKNSFPQELLDLPLCGTADPWWLSPCARRTTSEGPGTLRWSPLGGRRAGSVCPVHLSQDPKKKMSGVEGRRV